MFSILSKRETIISATFILSSANAFNSDLSTILLFGKELIGRAYNWHLSYKWLITMTNNAYQNNGKEENTGNRYFSPYACFIPLKIETFTKSHLSCKYA